MKFFDLNSPFFLPVWRRVAMTGVCLGWALVELASGAVFWGALFGVAGLYCAWALFVAFDEKGIRERENAE